RLNGGTSGRPSYTPDRATDLALSSGRGTDVGVQVSPTFERLIPVIAKLQIVFSIVSHHAHIGDRMNFYNNEGVPKGNLNHAVPHLAYDPIITLYNPYDVELDLTNLRIRVWDPPVGFRFQKVAAEGGPVWYRPEMAQGEFHGLARFQIDNETNDQARRTFTLILSDGTPSASASSLVLEPGEVKVFSPRVEENWNWALETASEMNPRSFFDWKAGSDFGNRDNRSTA